MLFCAFKMAVAFAFLCKNAVEAIYAQNHWNSFKSIKVCWVTTALKQQLLGIVLCFFMHLKWLWLLCVFAQNAVEVIQISSISMILSLNCFYREMQ